MITEPWPGMMPDMMSLVRPYIDRLNLFPAPEPESIAPWTSTGEDPEARAMNLLVSHLDEAQAESLQRYGFFYVRLNYTYRISISSGHAGIVVADYSPGGGYLCINPDRSLPAGDQALSLLLALRADETKFRTVANTMYRYI